MADFDSAVEKLLEIESPKLLDDPKTGEYSRFGVTLKTAAGLGLCMKDDRSYIDNLTPERATAFYRAAFWMPLRLDEVHDALVATKLLDMAVNMGMSRAVKIAQIACREMGQQIAVDGLVGERTIAAINACAADTLLCELRSFSRAFYMELVQKDPAKYAKYWEGWKARAAR